ncbi:uncharacterized protein LOC121380822 [Gigantopelta aegis]|uniref:uncharacterized protein LOC121380822 n=1 Tax=Gigantopelta aegis TaxID=1735272 RepID=UPI001B88A74B|nr:uncharacterized protein LOC121380822 [Gigantopelta aegis]
MDTCSIFQTYRYAEDSIPPDLSTFNPILLHEGAILHEVDSNKKFRSVGNGTFSTAFLAQFRRSGKPVVVKTFRRKYQEYDGIDLEFRIHKYLEDTGHVPNIYGLLSTGSEIDAMSLVIEYLQNSITLSKLLNSDQIQIPACFWLYIGLEIARILRSFHEKQIVHNDLHGNNVLIQWREKGIQVYIIDFGGASFRCGTHHSFSNQVLSPYLHMAPELAYEVSSPAVDVYALGNILKKGKKYVNSSVFSELAEQCHQKDKLSRPNLDDVITKLQTIGSNCSNVTDFLRDYKPAADIKYDVFSTLSPPLIAAVALEDIFDVEQWTIREEYYIRIVEFVPAKRNVIVKIMSNRSFSLVRQDALFHMYLSDTGYVLKLIGLSILKPEDGEVVTVLELFANGRTLSDVISVGQCNTLPFLLVLSLDLSKAVGEIHGKSVMINNLRNDSVLVDIVNGEPKVKISHLVGASFVGKYIDDNYEKMAPEVVADEVTSFASDIYTLGVILSEIFQNIKEMPNELQVLIKRCQNEKPGLRPTASQIVESISDSITQLWRIQKIHLGEPQWHEAQCQGNFVGFGGGS